MFMGVRLIKQPTHYIKSKAKKKISYKLAQIHKKFLVTYTAEKCRIKSE